MSNNNTTGAAEPLVNRNGRLVGYRISTDQVMFVGKECNTPMGRVVPVKMAFDAQPTSAPAAQSEVAAAPAEPAAEAETSTPPPRAMTKEEAIVELGKLAQTTDEPTALRALLVACKALARDGIHKRRNRAARASRAAQAKEAVA